MNLQESVLDTANAKTRTLVNAGEYYFAPVLQGETIRIVDVMGNEAADTLFFDLHNPSEHYSAVDTIREQRNVFLSTGTVLRSNKNQPLLTITADTCGRHDTLGGACSSESNTVRYDLEKRYMHSCRDNWMLALSQHPEFGIDKRDIAHNINFFMNVPITPEGKLRFADGISGPGKYVEMLAEKDVLVLISTCPQLNNPCNGYDPTPLEVIIWQA